MSRVIKGAIFQETSHMVTVPSHNKDQDEDQEEISSEIQENLLADIRKKEDRANELLRNAEITSAVKLQEAEAKAQEIIQAAQAQVEEIHNKAQQEGFAQGEAEGREAGIEQIHQEQQEIIVAANTKAENTIQIANRSCEEYVVQSENQIAEMVLDIANKVLPQHFIEVPQLILPLVREALQKVKDQPKIVVHVAPDAYELVLMAQNEFQAQLEGNASLSVTSDPTLTIGDCVIESPNGIVDAKLATQLESIKNAIRNVEK